MNRTEIIDKLNWRYATKKFDNKKKINQDDWNTLEKALILSASSYGLQPWKFVIVQDNDLRKKLTPVSYGQTQVEDSSHFIVFCALKQMTEKYIQDYIKNISEIRKIDVSVLNEYKNMMIGNLVTGKTSDQSFQWSSRQTYIALGTLLTSAAMLNIDACPMEGIDTQKYSEILHISDYSVVCACALGYRSEEDSYSKSAKVRFDKTTVIIEK